MGYYLTSIALLLLTIVIADRNAKLEDAEKAQRCIVIRHPRLYLWVGGLLVALVAGLYAWSFFDPEAFAGKTWPDASGLLCLCARWRGHYPEYAFVPNRFGAAGEYVSVSHVFLPCSYDLLSGMHLLL